MKVMEFPCISSHKSNGIPMKLSHESDGIPMDIIAGKYVAIA